MNSKIFIGWGVCFTATVQLMFLPSFFPNVLRGFHFAGNALGPMIGTSVLAFSNLNWLYLTIGSMSLLALFGYAFAFRRR